MKIAIQGHSKRGKEVIQILESLGGINRKNHKGRCDEYFYYISSDDNTIAWICIRPQHMNVFTLEEFEKEFPFKIGDRVISVTTNFIGIITELKENGCYYVKYDNGNFTCTFGQNLKLYKEMERNITLTLEKAKEWYKKGGELKEIALQAFTEKELNPLPRSWEEFCENYPIRGEIFYIDVASDIQVMPSCATDFRDAVADRNICPSKESAEAHLAMIQLEQLRDCWRGDWKPEWNNCEKYVIKWDADNLRVFPAKHIHAFLAFLTREMAEEFLECFKDLIEKAGDLI